MAHVEKERDVIQAVVTGQQSEVTDNTVKAEPSLKEDPPVTEPDGASEDAISDSPLGVENFSLDIPTALTADPIVPDIMSVVTEVTDGAEETDHDGDSVKISIKACWAAPGARGLATAAPPVALSPTTANITKSMAPNCCPETHTTKLAGVMDSPACPFPAAEGTSSGSMVGVAGHGSSHGSHMATTGGPDSNNVATSSAFPVEQRPFSSPGPTSGGAVAGTSGSATLTGKHSK